MNIGVLGALPMVLFAGFRSNQYRILANCTGVLTGPKPADAADQDLFRAKLTNLIDQRHELVQLAELIDWDAFSRQWSPQLVTTTGRPAPPTWLMAALLYLKYV